VLKRINWPAALIAVLVLEALGWVWYGPLFGDRWMEEMEGAPQSVGMAATVILGTAKTALVVVGLSWLLARLDVRSVVGGLGVAFAAWAFFNFTTMAVDYLYLGHSAELVAINMGYQATSYLVAGAVIGAMRRRRG
jgi:hypothetical protein